MYFCIFVSGGNDLEYLHTPLMTPELLLVLSKCPTLSLNTRAARNSQLEREQQDHTALL